MQLASSIQSSVECAHVFEKKHDDTLTVLKTMAVANGDNAWVF